MGDEQEGEREGADGDQLEESVAGVLGVGQARRSGHSPRAAEQVADLDHHECQEHEVEETEHHPYLDDAEREYSGTWDREVLGDARHQPRPQHSRRDPGEEGHKEEVREDLGEVEAEDLYYQPLEDGVGRHQQRAEEEQERGGEQNTPRHRQRLPLPPPADGLAPFYVDHAYGQRSRGGQGASIDSTENVVQDAGALEAPAAPAPHGEGE